MERSKEIRRRCATCLIGSIRRAADFSLRPGDPVWIALDPEKLHFFEAESGKRIE